MDLQKTEIAILMDASGSMQAIRDDAVGGLNAFVADQKKEPGRADLTVTFFDSNRFDRWVDGIDLRRCPVLGHEYQPGASTPLLDATGRTIEELGDRLRRMPEAERPGKVLVIVITDGLENASCVFTKQKIREMIRHQEEVYKWEFVYLGANVDAFAEGGEMGYRADRIASYKSSKKGVRAMMRAVSNSARAYRRGREVENLGREIDEGE
jgi:hypothetical protein